MAKKKTAETSVPIDTSAKAAPSTPGRRRAVPRAAKATAPVSVANDRAELPEPAGQRVSPADTSMSDSITFVATTTTSEKPSYEEIAEAAYHRYLNRGASHGGDLDDWIEAERQLKSR
jgi:hypothetical protein